MGHLRPSYAPTEDVSFAVASVVTIRADVLFRENGPFSLRLAFGRRDDLMLLLMLVKRQRNDQSSARKRVAVVGNYLNFGEPFVEYEPSLLYASTPNSLQACS
jgi:hypothetical protein